MNFNLYYSSLSELEKTYIYIKSMRMPMNRRALFADGTKDYCRVQTTPEGYVVHLRFRTAKDNVDRVEAIADEENYVMELEYSDHLFDYYSVDIPFEQDILEYYFKICSGRMVEFYNLRGVMNTPQSYYNFKVVPTFKTPDWAKGAVFYQIFVDRFYNGDPANDVEDREYIYIHECTQKVNQWDAFPDAMDVRKFYGGDLQGVMDKLDYLKDLGVDVVYLNPIFVSPSNHKYDIQDYDYVDPHFGKIIKDEGWCLPDWENSNYHASRYITRVTDKANLEASNALFARLTEEIHNRGMRVILDGVFNHCGSFNKWMDREQIYENQEGYAKGAYVDENSPYRTFFNFHKSDWPYNKDYEGWWNHDTLPKLNYENSPKLVEYILGIGKKWLSKPYNVDGWRLDVAADLGHSETFNHRFWREFRKMVKETNPEALILAEHYGDPASWLQGDQWDTVMNYDAFMEPVTWFLTGMEKHSDEFRQDLLGNDESFLSAMSHHMSRFLNESLYTAMNELSNHDHSRFLTRTNRCVGRTSSKGPQSASQGIDKGLFRTGVLMQMTWPGAPTIYYGDEAGLCGWTDPDNRRTYPWGNEDHELIQYHKDMIKIHKSSKALMEGSIKFLYGSRGFLAYGRFNEDEKWVIVVNINDKPQMTEIPVWEIGVIDSQELVRWIWNHNDGYSLEIAEHSVVEGKLCMEFPAKSAMVFKAV